MKIIVCFLFLLPNFLCAEVIYEKLGFTDIEGREVVSLRIDGSLSFDIKMIPYKGNDAWIEPTLEKLIKCLKSQIIPDANESCDYCKYINKINLATEHK